VWRRPDRGSIEAARDTAEAAVVDDTALAVRRFLTQATRAARASLGTPALVAAGTPVEPITLGAFERFWIAAFTSASLDARIRDAWLSGFRITSDLRVTATSLDAVPVYMATITDRLVHGLTPPLHADAFDQVRVITTRATSLGWTTQQTSQRIAAELGWETHAPYWRTQLARTNTEIDRILDPLGRPGTAAREHARLHDARVRVLQADRATLVRHLDAERSYWQTRAERIARTETTGAYGAGSEYALQQEHVACKEWLATRDARTRPEHAAADGQVVKVGHPFSVGGFQAQHPGAANLPPELSVHCRCCLVGAECDR
jgi:hypothetical protein